MTIILLIIGNINLYNYPKLDTFILLSRLPQLMTPLTDFEGELVRDRLSKGEIHWIKSQRELKSIVQLIELSDLNGSFAGYFPMNAKLRDGLEIVYNDDDTLSTCPVVVGG